MKKNIIDPMEYLDSSIIEEAAECKNMHNKRKYVKWISIAASIFLVFSLLTGVVVYAAENIGAFSEPKTEEEILQRIEDDLSKDTNDLEVYPDDVMQVLEPADNLKVTIKILDEIEYNLNTIATSENGRVASMQKNTGSVWYELVVTDNDEVERYKDVSTLSTSVLDMEWLDEDTLQIIGHVNPSTEELIVYNNGNFDKYYGTSFERDSSGTLYYVSSGAYLGYGEMASAKIVDGNDKVYFETAENESIVDMNVTDDYFVMYVVDRNNSDKVKLVVVSRKDLSVVYEDENVKYGKIVIE